MTRQTDALGQCTEYQYDLLGRLTSVIYPDQMRERFDYDSEDNLLAHVDAKGQSTRYRYNGQGMPIERIDAKGQRLRYTYDAAMRLSALINGNDERYSFSYHPQGWLAQEIGFDGKTTRYSYDAAGRLIGSDCNGQQVTMMRDANGQLRAKGCQQNLVHYDYDALGRLVAVASPHSQQRYLYDAEGQLLQERSQSNFDFDAQFATRSEVRSESRAFVLSHSYDELGNRIQTILPNGRKIDTLRYGSGHWHGSLWQGQALLDVERDQLHRERRREIGAHAAEGKARLAAYSNYDPQSRLSHYALTRGQQQLRRRQYQYDSVGNLTDILDSKRGHLGYRYDPLGQLLSAMQPGASEYFSFDPAGNLLDPEAAPKEAPIWRASERRLDRARPRLSRVTQNLLQTYQGSQYVYDAQGNTIIKRMRYSASSNEGGELQLAYDDENRLVSTSKTWLQKRTLAEYRYDAFNRRIAKRVTEQSWAQGVNLDQAPSTNHSKTTYFVWDGDVLTQEIDDQKTVTYLLEPESFVPMARIESQETAEFYRSDKVHIPPYRRFDANQDPANPSQHVQEWQRHHSRQREQQHQVHLQQNCALAEHSAKQDQIHYYQCDHLGTPLELLDEAGNSVWEARYKAWGRVLQYDVRQIEQNLRFQGQYFDAETGLHYNRHRYYDPDAARFITQDPIGLAGGENVYSYAPNAQAWIDPLGLQKGNSNPSKSKGKTCDKFIRLRHYAGPSRAKAIMADGVIQPGEHFRVYFEPESNKPLSAQKVAEKYRIPVERGRAYVETDVCSDKIEWKTNPLYGTE